MTTPISVFTTLDYVCDNIITYLNEIKYNVEIITSLGEQTDDSGSSVDWNKNNGSWKTVSIGIYNLFNQMNSKKLGIFNNVNTYQFDFYITYYTSYQKIKAIRIAYIDFKYLCDVSPDCVFDNNTYADSEKLDKINSFITVLNNIIATFEALSTST